MTNFTSATMKAVGLGSRCAIVMTDGGTRYVMGTGVGYLVGLAIRKQADLIQEEFGRPGMTDPEDQILA